MGIISGKVAALALTGSLTVGAFGFAFTGGETVDQVKAQLEGLKNKVTAYEFSENALFEKIGLVKADATEKLTFANGKIVEAKNQINDLEAEKSLLTKTNAKLTAERDQLLADKAQLEESLASANADKARLNQELEAANAKIAELNNIIAEKNAEIAELEGEVSGLEKQLADLQADYDALFAENEANKSEAERANAEVKKANEKVAELGDVSADVEDKTENLKPMTQEELDAISTENKPDVFDAELVVKNLGLTYIQDGQSEAFKAAHPDLNIQEGDRVWRISNSNAFKVYVEYVKGNEKGELVANPSQTFYLTESGGTMIIKWQDENGVWKQTVKAGA
ncbi:hypothetical protein ACTSEZ_17530 [Metabacillus sp. JX24]|uniref:hypothetical protein n=1 Tax=Metabacillus sp. JX24 TaxID=3240759 RepID=UPI00350E9C1B